MLYRLSDTGRGLGTPEPLPFLDVADLQQTEKDLENLLADNLFDVLFEDAALMTIFQERQRQPEADIYALNREGDLVIFELKRGLVDGDAVLQAIRYAQDAGQWSYSKLECHYNKFRHNSGKSTTDLREAHKDAFQLESALSAYRFNCRTHMYVVGSAANSDLIGAIDFWKRQGLSVEFLPYRIYEIQGQRYFEFFSPPYDRHRNPATIKGVLFDTNRTWNEDAIWEMMRKARVSAYGDQKHVVKNLNRGDIVFYYHKWVGVVAAAKVTGRLRFDDANDEGYRKVNFQTPIPSPREGIRRKMTAAEVSRVTGRNFYWPIIMKRPYLDRNEAQGLLAELNNVLGS